MFIVYIDNSNNNNNNIYICIYVFSYLVTIPTRFGGQVTACCSSGGADIHQGGHTAERLGLQPERKPVETLDMHIDKYHM